MGTKNMTSRERGLAALRGLPVDRVPVFYWLNPHATCRMIAEYQPARSGVANWFGRHLWRRFKRQGGLDAGEWTRALPLVMEEYGNGRYALELGADVSIQSPELSSPTAFITSVRKRGGRLTFKGPFDVTLGMGGVYAFPLEPAVADARDLRHIEFPPITDAQFAGVRRFRDTHPDVCVACEVFAFQQVLCDYIMGMERFMLALYDYPDEIAAFLSRLADWVVDIIRHAARTGADVLCFADDYGTTGQPLISMAMWKTFTYPHLKRFIAVAHEEGVPFMLHSCGYQMPFLEYYVEAELDLLQSFQPKAGNDLAAAYDQYGDRLAFATGIDIQRGETMTPEELRQEILDNYAIGRTKGRFILGTTHMLQYSMPMENLQAIFRTVQEIQAGLHS
jgi:uroporphyrinogen-III decarboxylase